VSFVIEDIAQQDLQEGINQGKKLDFGKSFADRMFYMEYQANKWQKKKICAYQSLNLSPATMVLHYAQEIFEGLKAYQHPDGKIALFRPEDNFRRMNSSALRMCMPEIDVEEMVETLKALIQLEKRFVPANHGEALYIRPTMIGADPVIRLKSSESFIFFIILSPVGAYYANGFNPTSILVEENYVRAVEGGVGFAKTGANYAASLLAGREAVQKGFDQVLWLDGKEHRYIEEVGSMNIFFLYENKLVTPELNGSILPGITRDSVLKLAQHWGLPAAEEKLDIKQILEDIEQNKIKEVFGSGTAAVISPVGSLNYRGKAYDINNNQTGEQTLKFYEELTGIQYGTRPDPFGWLELIGN